MSAIRTRTEVDAATTTHMPKHTCPTCRRTFEVNREEDAPNRPFCSDRCQQVDLGKWLREEYVISEPLIPNPDDPEQAAPRIHPPSDE